MKKRLKSKIIFLLVIFILTLTNLSFGTEVSNLSTNEETNEWNTNSRYHNVASIAIPEEDVIFTPKNIVKGVEIYLLVPVDLFNYNLQRFIDLNIENNFDIEKSKAENLKQFFDHGMVLEYIDYLAKEGYETENNSLEIRHYSICMNNLETMGYYNLEDTKYVEFKLDFTNSDTFKLVLKDYLSDYDISNVRFLIDDGGEEKFIKIGDSEKIQDESNSSKYTYNISYEYYTDEEFAEFNKEVGIGYLIIMIIIFITLLIVVIRLIIKAIKEHKELQKRLFYKHKLTKEEKKELKLKKKQEKLEEKKNRKNKHKRR